MNQETEPERRLPVARAFVVQLAAAAAVAPGRLEGRVEPVVAGAGVTASRKLQRSHTASAPRRH